MKSLLLRKIYFLTIFELTYIKKATNKNQAINKKLKKKQLNYLAIILILIIATPIYVRQYKNIYPDSGQRKDLSIKGIFLD